MDLHWPVIVFLGAAVIAVWSWFAVEVYRFSRGKSFITGKQLGLRGAIAVLVLVVAGAIIWVRLKQWDDTLNELTAWAGCLAIILVIIILTMRDWRLVLREKHLKQADLYRRLDSEMQDPADAEEGD